MSSPCARRPRLRPRPPPRSPSPSASPSSPCTMLPASSRSAPPARPRHRRGRPSSSRGRAPPSSCCSTSRAACAGGRALARSLAAQAGAALASQRATFEHLRRAMPELSSSFCARGGRDGARSAGRRVHGPERGWPARAVAAGRGSRGRGSCAARPASRRRVCRALLPPGDGAHVRRRGRGRLGVCATGRAGGNGNTTALDAVVAAALALGVGLVAAMWVVGRALPRPAGCGG